MIQARVSDSNIRISIVHQKYKTILYLTPDEAQSLVNQLELSLKECALNKQESQAGYADWIKNLFEPVHPIETKVREEFLD